MGNVHIPLKAKLFAGLFAADTSLFLKARKLLERSFGKTDYESPVLDFSHTDYYCHEFGPDLKRQFFGFFRSVDLESIYKTKIISNRIEMSLAKNGKRTINIDPGYLTLSKIVLLTTKDYTHRVYLSKGIHAEVTLHYKGGTFNPWPWTYPDYKTKEYIEIFNIMRELYHKEGGRAC